jgi:hypothetical protein
MVNSRLKPGGIRGLYVALLDRAKVREGYVAFHFSVFGIEHLELRHLAVVVFWPIIVVMFVLGMLGIVNIDG